MSRQRLLALVREIVKDNQIQLPNHISNNSSVNGSLDYSQISHLRAKSFDSKIRNTSNETLTNGTFSLMSDPNCNTETGDNGSQSDYDIILHHKINREWPQGTSKEKRKYLGRRSSNFEVSNGELYYIKDGKCRKWLSRDEDVYKCFVEKHIDRDTNEHYSKEKTFDSIVPYFYTKNLNDILTRIYNSCGICRSRSLSSFQNPYGTRSSSLLSSGVNEEIINSHDHKESTSRDEVTGNSDPQKRMIVVKTLQAQASKSKNPRKSIPQRYQRLPDDEDITMQFTSQKINTQIPSNQFSSMSGDVNNEFHDKEPSIEEHEINLEETSSPQDHLAGLSQSFAV